MIKLFFLYQFYQFIFPPCRADHRKSNHSIIHLINLKTFDVRCAIQCTMCTVSVRAFQSIYHQRHLVRARYHQPAPVSAHLNNS